MIDNPLEEAQQLLNETAIDAARNVLSILTGRTIIEVYDNEMISEIILEALGKLPGKGKIRRKNNKRIINAVSYLINEIPTADPKRNEIKRLFADALSRSNL